MRKVLYILGVLNDSDIEWMLKNGTKEHFKAGQVLIREQQTVSAIYIVLDGELSIASERHSGREIAVLGQGEIVGEMSMIEARPPSVSVKARKDCTVLALSRSKIDARLKADTAFAARFYRALALFMSHRLRATTSQLGYGSDTPAAVRQEEDEEDELDPNLMDSVTLAGSRFDRLVKSLIEG